MMTPWPIVAISSVAGVSREKITAPRFVCRSCRVQPIRPLAALAGFAHCVACYVPSLRWKL